MKFTEQSEPVKIPPTLADVPYQHVFRSGNGIYLKLSGVECLVLRKDSGTQERVGETVNYPSDMAIDAWYDEIILAGAHR